MGVSAVRVVVRAWLVSDRAEGSLGCGLWYDPADPFAVVLALRTATQTVEWRIARELLAAGRWGVSAPAGGDVAVSPDGVSVRVELVPRSPRAAVIVLPREAVDEFLAESYRVVPAGGEEQRQRSTDWDRALAVLLADREEGWR